MKRSKPFRLLEKQFFDTFRIKPREFKSCDVGTFCPYTEKECGIDPCPYYRTYKVDYPEITDRILLELICILATHLKNIECCHFVMADNIETLKRHTLNDCMDYVKDIKHQVQELFKEER